MRGRPRKHGQRRSSGRLVVTADRGTAETRVQMALGAGFSAPDLTTDPNWIPDPRCAYSLGRLLMADKITREQHDTGVRLAELHRKVWGAGAAKSNLGALSTLGILPSGQPALSAAPNAHLPELALSLALKALKHDQKIVLDVCIWGDAPPRFAPSALHRLCRGLDALRRHWGGRNAT